MAALAAAECLGTPAAAILDTLTRFEGLPHRSQLVASGSGVRWVDDSKGTNVDATAKSLEGYSDGTVILILGGRDKHGDFAALADLVARRARMVLTIGGRRDNRGPRSPARRASSAGHDGTGGRAGWRLARPGDRSALAGLRFVRPVQELRRARPPLRALARAAPAANKTMAWLASDKILFGALVALSLSGCV
jgi:hypothetical protein